MKSNKPIIRDITKVTYNEDGTVNQTEVIKDVLFDRLGIQMHIGMNEGNNSPITQGVSVRFKKCSETGEITNDEEVSMVFPNIAKCTDMDVLICFSKIDAALTELVNKKGF